MTQEFIKKFGGTNRQYLAKLNENKEAIAYATNLLMSMTKRIPNVSPDWTPLTDIIGLLTQIDNASTYDRDRANSAESKISLLLSKISDWANEVDALGDCMADGIVSEMREISEGGEI